MDALVRRDSTTCEGSKQWYVCSAGNFRGCCATDPCTSGICLDDGLSWLPVSSKTSPAMSELLSTSTMLRMSTSTVPVTPVSYTTTATTVVSSDTSSLTTVATSTEYSSSATTPTSTTTATVVASTSTKSTSKGPIIGGTVAGIVAVILSILLLWLCWRRKRRHGKSYRVRLLRSPFTKFLHDREIASVSKMHLPPLENTSTNSHGESHHGGQTPSPQSNSKAHADSLSTSNSTTALCLTLSPDPSEYSTFSSGVLTTSSGGFIRLPPLRMPSTETPNSIIPQSEPQAAELSDTGFYRQRAELPAYPQSELINVPLERRRRKSPLAQGTSPGSSSDLSPSSSSGSGSSNASPRSAVDKTGSSTVMSRQTPRRVVRQDGIVMGANLDRYSTVRDPERGETKKGKKSDRGRDTGQEHVMSFMTFGRSEFDLMQRGPGSSQMNGSATRSVSQTVLEEVVAPPIGDAPPAYEAGGVAPKQDDK